MNKHALLVVFIAGLSLFAVSTVAVAVELVLVKEGAGPAPIVVFEEAPPITRQAADEPSGVVSPIRPAENVVVSSVANFFG